MSIPLNYYIVLSMILFSLGIAGVTTRRNPILIFMSIELMLNAVNLSLIAFGRYLGDAGGQMLTIFVMAVAAAEVSVGLGILIAIFRTKDNVDVDVLNGLKG
ncbi:MAG: NADH-quinone oxidoreductase subunit NuoK [Armatimonadaceae bacterium]|jgi:NADH-quinone oxidoreductase subunit K